MPCAMAGVRVGPESGDAPSGLSQTCSWSYRWARPHESLEGRDVFDFGTMQTYQISLSAMITRNTTTPSATDSLSFSANSTGSSFICPRCASNQTRMVQ